MRSRSFSAALFVISVTVLAGCAKPSRVAPEPLAGVRETVPAPLPPLPAPAVATGPLRIKVVYPKEDHRVVAQDSLFIYAADAIQSRDSAFVFGSLGRGDARLTVNGADVPVYPTGSWLAWVPLPDDTIARFDLIASAGSDTARAHFFARLPRRFHAPPSGAWVDTTSFAPAGARWIRPEEEIRLSVRASFGSEVRLRLPDGRILPLRGDRAPEEVSRGELAFGTAAPSRTDPIIPDRFTSRWSGRIGPDPGPILAPLTAPAPDDGQWAVLEAINGPDTLRYRWPLRLGLADPSHPTLGVVYHDTAGFGKLDSVVAGRPAPQGVYNWFFPNSTLAAISGRWNDRIRLQLSRGSVAWVDAPHVRTAPPELTPPAAIASSPRLIPGAQFVTLRVPVTAHVPFRVDASDAALTLRLYGTAADMEWVRYTGTDPFVKLIEFSQPAEDEMVVTVSLTQAVWGYRTRWEGNMLLLEIRRPPAIDPAHPLQGRKIALDAGHPPAGATGPSGVYEGQIVLAVARTAKAMLDSLGANTVLIRTSDSAMELQPRLQKAEAENVDVMVSIHANALPDGVNPFVNSGTSVYYFHPPSAPLARALDRSLVHQFGFHDLGMGRGDLALVRSTWMPSALTEGLFIMVPDQEYWLTSPEGQRRYARGLVDGIETFLRERSK